RDEHGAVLVRIVVEDEVRLGPPAGEQRILEARAGDALEVDGRDDLVGVDVRPAQRHPDTRVDGQLLHDQASLGAAAAAPEPVARTAPGVTASGMSAGRARASAAAWASAAREAATASGSAGGRSTGADSVPRTAVAAATSGLTRCVRPPLPWRPSKLRFEVEAQRSPSDSWSGFMPRHIEQPAKRQSAPAALKTWSRPSSSACRRTRAEPGTTMKRMLSAFVRPRSTSAAARRSSMRELVHEPRNTVSIVMSRSGVPGVRPM